MTHFAIIAGVFNLGVWIRSKAGNASRWKAVGIQAIGLAIIAVAVCLIPALLFRCFPQY
jgi:hypothetical protein